MLDLRRAICISPISNSTHHNQQYLTNSLATASTSTILVTSTITTIIVIIHTILVLLNLTNMAIFMITTRCNLRCRYCISSSL